MKHLFLALLLSTGVPVVAAAEKAAAEKAAAEKAAAEKAAADKAAAEKAAAEKAAAEKAAAEKAAAEKAAAEKAAAEKAAAEKGAAEKAAAEKAAAEKATAEKVASEKVAVFHYSEDDLETGRVLSDTIKAGSYAGKCLLVTVISSTESYHRDLAATVQGDIADGALLLRRNLVNEIGAISFKAGANSTITLQEDNSTFLYTAMSEKARGKGIEEFSKEAAKAGFLVSYESGVECLGTARDEDLKKAAEAHIEALRSKREKLAEIAKR